MPKQVETPPQAEKTLFVKVETYDKKGEKMGSRIVDMYHFGTRNWLQNHIWWAMHNEAGITQSVCSTAEVEAYMTEAKAKLAAQFNGDAKAA